MARRRLVGFVLGSSFLRNGQGRAGRADRAQARLIFFHLRGQSMGQELHQIRPHRWRIKNTTHEVDVLRFKALF